MVKFWRSKHGLVKVLEITANLRQPSPTPNIQSRAVNHRGGCVGCCFGSITMFIGVQKGPKRRPRRLSQRGLAWLWNCPKSSLDKR